MVDLLNLTSNIIEQQTTDDYTNKIRGHFKQCNTYNSNKINKVTKSEIIAIATNLEGIDCKRYGIFPR